jgi:hypothetical protein
MKPLEITSSMRTMGGIFYPKGYAFVMFPTAEAAQQVGAQFGDEAMLLTPRQVMFDVGLLKDESDIELPSVGTEGATVRKFTDLARKGHHALMVKIDSDEAAEQLMVAARAASFSYGQRYHLLAMEDLE